MNTAEQTGNGTAYELHGITNAPVVTLIHGLGLNRHLWQAFVAALAVRYRVLTYDLFGHGDSAPPPGEVSLALFSEQLRALLDELRIEKCIAAGFSLGGMINRRLAIDYPARVIALAIFNSPHQRNPQAQKLAEERATQTAAGGIEATLDSTMTRWFTPEFRAAQPQYIAQTRQWLLANDPAVYAQCRLVLAKGVTELTNPTPPIPHPALIITCENDIGSTPAMSHAIAADIPDAEVHIVPGLQHMGLVEEPGKFTDALLQFLGRSVKLRA